MSTLREQNLKHKGIMKKNLRPRYSITDPYEKFWPLLDSKNSKLLVDEMKKAISKENGKLKVNWFSLKKLPLDVRKCQIKDLSNKHKLISPNLKTQRLILKMGINKVSRCIEKDQIACCLIAEDVANCTISKHLLFMTTAKKIPVVILPNMRSITKHIIGFSSAVLGFKTDILNRRECSLYDLYQTIINLSNTFKIPYSKQIVKEVKTVKNPLKLKVDVENYLLKKPREGKAYVPGGVTSNIQVQNDLSFIPIENVKFEDQKLIEEDEELIEIPSSSNLFSIDTRPLQLEDIGESVERRTKPFRQPLRYHELKMKKMKPNTNRKLKEDGNIDDKKN